MTEVSAIPDLVIDYHCRNCGEQLAVIGQRHGYTGVSIAGLRDLVYVHAANRLPTCTVTYQAEPFDAWAATRAFEDAQRARWDEEDRRASEDDR